MDPVVALGIVKDAVDAAPLPRKASDEAQVALQTVMPLVVGYQATIDAREAAEARAAAAEERARAAEQALADRNAPVPDPPGDAPPDAE